MEAFLGDTEEGTDDSPEPRKSKLKLLKTRLFGKSKKAGETSSRKLSQSASDITAAKDLGFNEDLLCSQGVMGSRALSHDSIFLADQLTLITESEPARVLSQENVHSKIKALQEKLQQQKFHLGRPPMIPPVILPSKQDETSPTEDVHPSEMTKRHTVTQDNLNKVLSQMTVNPVLPTPSLNKPAAPKSNSPIDEAPLDLSAPPQFTPSLDTSAARHRLSIKPRNQRASSKKRHTTGDPTAVISTLNSSETLKEEDRDPDIQEESEKQTEDSKPIDMSSVQSESTNPEPTSKTPGIESSFQQDISILGKMPTVTTQILRPKSHRPADVMPRPHSSFIPSEVKGKSESSGNSDIQFLRDTQNKTWASDMKTKIVSTDPKSASPGLALRSSVVLDETDRTAAIKRSIPGSGSFHLSVSASKSKEEEDRPRSGSFTGVRGHAWIKAGQKQLDSPSPIISPKVDSKPSGASLNLGREETLTTKDSLRKVDSAMHSKNKVTDTGDGEGAKEGEQGEGKTTFGIKLRSTSQSVRLRAEAASNECSRSEMTAVNKQDTSDNADQESKKTTCTSEETKPDVSTAPSTASAPTKQTVSPPLSSAEAQPPQLKGVPQAPVGPQPHATSTEVSWMSVAIEKTKSLQNLFASKFPRDLTGPTATHLQKTQGQTFNRIPPDIQTQDTKSSNQPFTDGAKTEVQQYKAPAQTIKQSPSSNTAQQNTPKASLLKEAQIKPTEREPTSTESTTQSAIQGNIWTTQSPLRSVRQVENASLSSPHLTSRQPPWSTRSLKSTGQAVTPSSQDSTAECTVSATNVEETDEQPVWGRSVSKKAVFLEKRAEWTSTPVEVKKTETPTTSEPSAQSKETKANVDSGTKHRDTVPQKIPERPIDKKWLCKSPESRSASSPSSTPSSSLQSLSDSGELSWIELAKRKSMAWSDKTMD